MKYKVFKYRGRKIYITEAKLKEVAGVRVNMTGYTIAVLNDSLTKRKKQLIYHRIVTGRRVENIIPLERS